jgi:uncharacterized RDD family membrane protein YckC
MGKTEAMAAYPYPAPQAPSDPTAVTGRRIGAFFIDAAIAIVAFTLIFVPLATKRTVEETLALPGCHRKLDDYSQVECDNRQVVRIGDTVYEADGGPTFGLDLVFVFVYFGLLPGLAGVTLGKLLTGIRVVDESGAVAGIGRSLIRWLVFAVDGPLSLFLCGLLTSLLTKGHRRLGDMAAGTYVVAAASVGRPIALAAPMPAYPGPPSPAGASPPPPPPPPPPPTQPQWDPARNT